MTPQKDDADANRENNYDEQQQKRSEVAYRSSSPPVPTLKNKDKKQKSATNNTRRQSYDDLNQEPSLAHLDTNDDYPKPPPADDTTDSHGRQTYRKPPTPRQPGLLYVPQKLAIVLCCCLCFLL